MRRSLPLVLAASLLALVPCDTAGADPTSEVVKSVTIRTPRDIGYFAGDLVKADVSILVSRDATIDMASLPQPGPIEYWLDLRSIGVETRAAGQSRVITLHLLYQNFYDALDARPMEIPTFAVRLKSDNAAVTADIPPWTIGVSPLREVAPPVKSDPKDYLQPDRPASYIETSRVRQVTVAVAFAALLALAILAYNRAWPPFHVRPRWIFAAALRRLRKIKPQRNTDDGYLDALLVLHRGLDQADGQRILADDMPEFLRRHPGFAPLESQLAAFFSASRKAFFGSNPSQARREFPFDALERFAWELARAERVRP